MATLPSVPSFAFQETPTLAKLQALAGAVTFVTQMPIVVSLKRNATQAIAANTSTAVQWNVSETDSDAMHSNVTNPSRLTCVTQGYYKFHATVTLNQTVTAAYVSVWFQQTTGANNPQGAGHSQIFGINASQAGTTTADFISQTISSISPCLFIGDYVEAFVFSTVASTLQFNFLFGGQADAAGKADGASCLTGMYLFEGP